MNSFQVLARTRYGQTEGGTDRADIGGNNILLAKIWRRGKNIKYLGEWNFFYPDESLLPYLDE